MFDFNFRQVDPYAQVGGGPGDDRWGRDAVMIVAARDRFDRARRIAQSRRLLARIFRRPRDLLDLNRIHCSMSERHYAGVQTVPIRNIVGSEGRCRDFDRDFLPLQPMLAQRWISVFVAMVQGIAMPPVTLIRVGDVYFVRDGHHRISVSRMRGCDIIEAEVTVWNAKVDLPFSEAPAAAPAKSLWRRPGRNDGPVTIP